MTFDIDPTKEPIIKGTILLSIPMIIEMMAQNLFNLVDTYFVSRIAYQAIGALVTSGILLTLFLGIASGISIATGMYIATFWGGKKYKRSMYLYSNSIILASGIAIFLAIFTYIFLSKILLLIGLKGKTFIYAKQYLEISLIGLITTFIFAINSGTIRALALPSIALKVVILGNILNAIFDPFFIFYLGFGIKGAGISTILSLFIGILLQLKFLHNKNFKFVGFRLNKKMISGILKNGMFSSVQLVLRTSSMLILMKIIGSISQQAIAAFGVVLRVFQVLLFIIFGFSNATFVMVGQNFGAKLIERIKKSVKFSLLISFIIVLILDFLIYLFKDPIVSIFVSNQTVKEIAFEIIFFYAISYPIMSLNTIAIRVSRALHDTIKPSIIEFISLWLFQLPFAYFLSRKLSAEGIWIAIAVSIYLASVLNLIVMKVNLNKVISKYTLDKGFQNK